MAVDGEGLSALRGMWKRCRTWLMTPPPRTHRLGQSIYIYIYIYIVGWVAQSLQRLTTGWTVRDRIPVGTRFSARPDRPWDPLSLLYNGYRVFPGGKVRPGSAADHSPPSSAAVMEE